MRRILLTVLFSLWCLPVMAGTYYVSTTGSDEAGVNGSQSTPWATLSHACATVPAGTNTIHIVAGTYNDNARCNIKTGTTIVGDGATKEDVVINTSYGTTSGTGYIYLVGTGTVNPIPAGNITIHNLTINGNSTAWCGIFLRGYDHIDLHDLKFTNFLQHAIFLSGAYDWTGQDLNEPQDYGDAVTIHDIETVDTTRSPATGWCSSTNLCGAINIGALKGATLYNLTLDEFAYGRGVGVKSVWGWLDGFKGYNWNIRTYQGSGTAFVFEMYNFLNDSEIYNSTFNHEFSLNGGITNKKVGSTWNLTIHHTSTDFGGMTLSAGHEHQHNWYNFRDNYVANKATKCGGIWTSNGYTASAINNQRYNNNVFYNCGQGGVTIERGALSNIEFYNNVFDTINTYSWGGYGIEGEGFSGSLSGMKIQNNIFRNCQAGSAYFATGITNTTFTNNITTGSGHSNTPNGTGTITNNAIAAPGWNGTGNKPHPYYAPSGTSSNLVDTGINVGLSYFGTVPDKGAYELTNGTCGSSDGQSFATAPTTNLCTDGSTPTVLGPTNGLFTWTCAGTNGGTNGSCSATSAQSNYELPADRSVDWTVPYIGVYGDIPTNWPVYNETPLTPGADIQAALNNAGSAGKVVVLGAGTFNVGTQITVPSNRILRGQGKGSTILHGTSGLASGTPIVRLGSSSGISSSHYTSAALSKGQTVVTLNASPGWSDGALVLIDATNASMSAIPVIGCGDGCGSGTRSAARSAGQVNRVVHCAGAVCTFETPLMWNFPENGTEFTLINSPTYHAGLEDLKIDNQDSGNQGTGDCATVNMFNCSNCWIKGVDMYGSLKTMLRIKYSYGSTIRGSNLHDGVPALPHPPSSNTAYNTSRAYGIWIGPASNILVENNELYYLAMPVKMDQPTSYNVFGYNVITNLLYNPSPGWNQGAIDAHGGHPMMNLFEGNILTGRIDMDNTWGSSSHNTFFRNRRVVPTAAMGIAATGARYDVDLQANAHYHNFINNVFGGWPGQTETVYEVTSGDDSGVVVYRFGRSADSGSYTDSNVIATVLRHGNWDRKNNGVVYKTDENRSFPASLYRTSQPSWWGSAPWPAIGSDVNPMAPADSYALALGSGTPFEQGEPSAVNGACGLPNGTTVAVPPSTNLCSAGISSEVTTGATQYTWTCAGSGGGATASCAANIDLTAPTTTASPTAGTYSVGQSIALSCADNVGCEDTFYCIGAGCNPTTTYTSAVAMAFSNTLRFYSTDTKGNAETVKQAAYTISNYDTTPPTVPANPMAIGTSTSTIDVTWDAATDEVAIGGYAIYRNDVFLGLADVPVYHDTSLPAGIVYTYKIRAYDTSNNYSDYSVAVQGATYYAAAPAGRGNMKVNGKFK